jgi:hypothetical protein
MEETIKQSTQAKEELGKRLTEVDELRSTLRQKVRLMSAPCFVHLLGRSR